jgi:outer membrane receptor for ferric coprogen and ferric-rhodotorulic acid
LGRKSYLSLIALLGSTAFINAAVAQQASQSVGEITITAVPTNESVLPTTQSTTSIYGLDLGVMDTPRNNTLLTAAQLEAVNVQDPHAFSYLTSSSYSDAAFGVPNVPRIRGQLGDVFFNGMRDSFTANGYGAPLSFNSFDTIDIVKGPASVQMGPGAGVGGSIVIGTKMPYWDKFKGSVTADFDTIDGRKWYADFGGPINDSLAYRVSYTGNQSDSFFNGKRFDQESVYGVLQWRASENYTLTVSSEASQFEFTEFDGVNRVNQGLINNGTYLTGGPAPGDQIYGFLTYVTLGNPTTLGQRVNIDEAPGTSSHAFRYNFQVQQSYQVNDSTSLTNNLFFNYENRDDQVQAYYADSCYQCFSIEDKTDLTTKYDLKLGDSFKLANQVNVGFTYRWAHINEIQGYPNEPVGIYDLTQSPSSWIYPASYQATGGGPAPGFDSYGFGGAFPYVSAMGRVQYGTPARDAFFPNASSLSDLSDAAVFFEHRTTLAENFHLMAGARVDVVKLREADNFPGAPDIVNGWPQAMETDSYGLANVNISPSYDFADWGMAYFTYNYAQYVDPIANDGGVSTYGLSASHQLHQTTRLYEAGMKFNLLDKSLFMSTAIYSQTRSIPTGQGGLAESYAHIAGVEAELNFQPNRHFFATASYSFTRTRLDTAASFYNWPAFTGVNVDGEANEAVFSSGQRFNAPDTPQHLFNVLANYKTDSGWTFQGNIQITGPMDTTTSGYIDLAATEQNNMNLGLGPTDGIPPGVLATGYYKAPIIPWQYTVNASVAYSWDDYSVKLGFYNITDQRNLIPDYSFYGNDFITRATPVSADLTVHMKF